MSILHKGSVLWTRDGRHIGNGIVLAARKDPFLGDQYTIKTDFGNIVVLSESDVERLFYPSNRVDSVLGQSLEQYKLLTRFAKGLKESYGN